MMRRVAGLCACLGVALMFHLAQAQGTRDPTQAPPGAGLVVPQVAGAAATTAAPNYSVIVVEGQPRLVVGTRLVAPGQMVGGSRLERITETEVWLLNGKELRKMPRFAGIQRTPVNASTGATDSTECPPVASGKTKRTVSSKSSSSAGTPPAGCATAQP